MGRDKALLRWGETTLLDHAVERLRACCRTVRILSGPERRYHDRGIPVDVDLSPGLGPLGGVVTGLSWLEDPLGLFLAVDLPRVPVALLERLLDLSSGYDAVVPVWAGRAEPLCAVYGRSCLPAIRRRLQAGDLKMTGFWPEVRVRRVLEDELRDLGDPATMFHNVNQPSDLTSRPN
jgi:molybdopterin-guanine dinucleotide biosynthesis protein A